MRRSYWIIIIIIFLAVLITTIWWWRRTQSGAAAGDTLHLKPRIGLASFNITDIDRDRVKLDSKIVLHNPLPIALSTNRIDYDIFIDSIRIIQSTYDKPLSIKPGDSSVLEIPMEIMAGPLARVLTYFTKNQIDSADYSIKGKFLVDVPIAGERAVKVDFTKRLPAVKLLTAKAGKINVDKLGLKESRLDMVMEISNPNRFPVKIKDGKYKVTIDEKMKIDGALQNIVNIPPNGQQDVSMHLDIKTSSIGKLAWKMLFEKEDTRFQLHFKGKLIADNKAIDNSNMAFNMNGTLAELKALKESAH